jgi:hypothetical protein
VTKYYIGVDPGMTNGAWAAVDQDGELTAWWHQPDMVQEFIAWAYAPYIVCANLEQQQVRHSDMTGGKIFGIQKLLINYGQWQGVFQALGIRYNLVSPLTWMARYKCAGRMPSNMRKKTYFAEARLRWPDRKWLEKDHDIAAAALLALMARDDDLLQRN